MTKFFPFPDSNQLILNMKGKKYDSKFYCKRQISVLLIK